MVLPSVLVGGEKETSAVYGHAVALTFVAVVVAPELDEPPELLLELPPLELLELELLDPELLELELELLEPELELLELELLELEPELLELELLEPELLELELELLDPELEPLELLEPELLELELELLAPELELLELEPELLELELELLDPELDPFELLEPELLDPELLEPELLELEPLELELELLAPELELLELEDADPLLLVLGTFGIEATVDVATVPVEAVAGADVSSSPQALNSIAPNTMALTGAVIDLIVYRVMKSLNSLVKRCSGANLYAGYKRRAKRLPLATERRRVCEIQHNSRLFLAFLGKSAS